MPQVISQDGVTIGYDVTGSGPALILVAGATQYRAAVSTKHSVIDSGALDASAPLEQSVQSAQSALGSFQHVPISMPVRLLDRTVLQTLRRRLNGLNGLLHGRDSGETATSRD